MTWDSSQTVVVIKLLRTSALHNQLVTWVTATGAQAGCVTMCALSSAGLECLLQGPYFSFHNQGKNTKSLEPEAMMQSLQSLPMHQVSTFKFGPVLAPCLTQTAQKQ